jgi:hypothetical protein
MYMSGENWLWAGRPEFDYREGQHFSLLHSVQIGSETYPVSYPMGTRDLSPGDKAAVA